MQKTITDGFLITILGLLMGTALAPAARADIPSCNDVVNDQSIATCTCICEASSLFSGCTGKKAGESAPTPNQCPDMLQGRRVISGGDAFVVNNPHESGSDTIAGVLTYEAQNDAGNPGLGVVNSSPFSSDNPSVACQGSPFPQQTRMARLFDLPYDMVVTMRPSTDGSQIKSDCFATNSTTHNFNLVVASSEQGAPTIPTFAFQANAGHMQLATGDFDYDGFDDIVFLNVDAILVLTAVDTSDPTKGMTRPTGANTKLPSGELRAPINEPTVGDFNGDGLLDAAWIGGDFPNRAGALSVFFATICPGDVPDTICAGAERFKIILDPAGELFPGVSDATSTIVLDNAPTTPTTCGVVQTPGVVFHPGASTTATDVMRAGTAVLGNFEDNGQNPRGAPIAELAVAYVSGSAATSSDPCWTDLQYWSFAPPTADHPGWAWQRGDTVQNLFPEVTTKHVGNPLNPSAVYPPVISLYGQAAYLDWYGSVQQAVIEVTGYKVIESGPDSIEAGSFWFPVTVSVSGTGEQAQAVACAGHRQVVVDAPLAWGMGVGRLSNSTTINTDNPSACGDFSVALPGDCPYTPQIGMVVSKDNEDNAGFNPVWQIYSVQQSQPDGDNSLKCANDPDVVGYMPVKFSSINADQFVRPKISTLRAGSLLHAGDVFGDSVRLGNPTVTRISEHSQPQVVIQTPPSHIDYVLPNEQDSTTPGIVNFTRNPDNFNTQIQFSISSSDTATSQQTTSYTASTTETVSGEVKFNVPLVSQVDVKNQESWKQYNENTTSQQQGNFFSQSLETGATVGADDQVWWTQTTFNVFHFPVIGQTACPASTTCNASDPDTSGCTTTASGVELTCTATTSGGGCQCLSEQASNSICPELPSTAGVKACVENSNNVCCTLLQQQLNMSISGPQEVLNSTAAGSQMEWYQPTQEPGQILSYPSSIELLNARTPNFQDLANLGSYSIGVNNDNQTISWSCVSSKDVSVGNTVQHSFETDSSITFGTDEIAEEAAGAASLTVGFDYQNSKSISTLNSHSVSQSASKNVMLNLQGAGFLDTDQYSYSLEGAVLGAVKPDTVLDNPDLMVCPSSTPDCTKDQLVSVDCQTTGPMTVAYAADPPVTSDDNNGAWWLSDPPYSMYIDVALNNPSRWRIVGPSGVENETLQCRGETCYTANQPQGATGSNVWDTTFYNMKGLLISVGGTAGPQRNQATVGDEVFLQARVYNYSLMDMPGGTKVYARIYRQQLDVNNGEIVDYAIDAQGNKLPAVPIGPSGLGDTTPIPVVSPLDGTATIPKFNRTTNPADDNISLATTSYVVPESDACEYDENHIQSCKGAYYTYWLTVWAEDDNGNVLSELPGHGLGTTFDPATIYNFITDVPLERVDYMIGSNPATFTNNVGMYKSTFSIVPANTDATLSVAAPGVLAVEQTGVMPERTTVHEPVIVSARITSLGAATPGATVLFSDGDPDNGGKVFDVEMLSHIRAADSHFTRVHYSPSICGNHEIFVRAVSARTTDAPVTEIVPVDVACTPPPFPVHNFHGQAQSVGTGKNNGTLEMKGTVRGVGDLMLNAATLKLNDLLREIAGAGELVHGNSGPLLPLRLTAQRGGTATHAIFTTAPSATSPKVRVEMKKRKGHKEALDFSIEVRRAVIDEPQLCESSGKHKGRSTGWTSLTSSFILTGGALVPITVSTEQTWSCKDHQLKTHPDHFW